MAGDLPIVLFLSRLHPKKGITDVLLPAFARGHKHAVLAIAGGVDESAPAYPAAIHQTIAQLGLGNRVAMLGPIPPADRWQLFDGAAAFVLPSHQENFGLVVAEAMARGCPVIVSDRVQSSEHVQAAGAGRVVPLGESPLSEAIDEILSDHSARIGMGTRGCTYAEENLRWDRVATRMVEIYSASRATPKTSVSW